VAHRPVPDWAGEIGCTSWPQLLLAFIVAHPAVTSVIPATSAVEHLRENIAVATRPLPDEAQRERIAAAALTA
jgi:aryl-alcohol dehydrogenase-like predicted oxidoreductase